MSREKAQNFGPHGHLTGILCEPLDSALGASKPAVLLSNVGVSHRVGPFRLNVEIARRLAAQGFYSLRFDFSGLGDSEASRDGQSEAERAVAEARLAMDLVTKRTGIRRFVLIGLCSGADKAHLIAHAEERVVGAVFIDGYAYPTPLFYLKRFTLRLLESKRIVVYVRTRWQRLRRRLSGAPPAKASFQPMVAKPAPERVEAELGAMAQRGIDQLHLYTISTDNVYNYAGQFWHMYPSLKRHRDRIVSERYPEVDHTLSIVRMQRLIVERLAAWMAQF